MGRAWQRSRSGVAPPTSLPAEAQTAAPGEAIATVDGMPIGRDQVVGLLLAGRGVSVLEELIVLELARREAQARGLTVSGNDVQAEYDRALRLLVNNLPLAGAASLDTPAAERMLDEVLAGRGISRQEYRLAMLGNAYLRKLAEAGLQITEDQLREEYGRAYGERVQVRHIQLAGGPDVAEVQRLLAAGADFAEVARGHSANAVTAGQGGLLAPFSRDCPEVPALLREAAFALGPGEVSNPVRVNNWYHVIKIEGRLPPEEASFEAVRSELRNRVRERLVGPEMRRISAELFARAQVEIADPALGADFFKQHPELRRSGR